MQDTEQWFTALYEQNASKMLRYASYQLRNASIALSGAEREILILFYEEELTHQEMSRRLGISEMNSRTRLFRAKNHCKKLFERKNCVCVTNGGDKSI